MSGKRINQDDINNAWFDLLLPAPEHDYRIAPDPAPEHEHIQCLSFDISIDFITGNKWRATIKQSRTNKLIWQSTAWSERMNAVHSAMHRVTSGKIFEDLANLQLDQLENDLED